MNIENLLTIDNTGLPKPPSIRQIQDKDVLELFMRDTSRDKRRYIAEAGYIYYMGDPKSPVHQQGLSEREGHDLAIDNYNLPKDYKPDNLVKRLITKYWNSSIGEAGMALNALHKSIHLISIAAVKINEILNNKLSNAISNDDVLPILNLMDSVAKKVSEIPILTASLKTAQNNLRDEEEEIIGRGGQVITSSMDADSN